MNRHKILIACHDAGGARALVPAAEELVRRGHAVHAVVAGPAAGIWRAECPEIPFTEMPDAAALGTVTGALRAQESEALLGACGLYNQIEHTARLAARSLGIPIVGLVDSWFNYHERFQRGAGPAAVPSLPNIVCVMDSWSGEEIKGFFPELRVELTGHPGLERAMAEFRKLGPVEREQCRQSAGALSGDALILFLSDPFYIGPGDRFYSGPGAIMLPDGRPRYGYTVKDILPALLEELDAAFGGIGRRARVAVRPHPSEYDGVLREILVQQQSRNVRAQLCAEGGVTRWIHAADAVAGMMTLALLQAGLLGKPSLSLEFGLGQSAEEDPCVSNRLGYSVRIDDRSGLAEACRRIARNEANSLPSDQPRPELPLEGAARRVADLVEEAARS